MSRTCLNPNGDTICRMGCAGNAACTYAQQKSERKSGIDADLPCGNKCTSPEMCEELGRCWAEAPEKKKVCSYAPIYCALYPDLAECVRKFGYALAVHGSLQRDFDLICIPWTDDIALPSAVVANIVDTFALRQVGAPSMKKHGRQVWTLSLSFGECFLDLSFMPEVAL